MSRTRGGGTAASCRVPVSQNDAWRDGDIVSRPGRGEREGNGDTGHVLGRGEGNDEEKRRGMGIASRPRTTRRWGRNGRHCDNLSKKKKSALTVRFAI